MKYIFLECFCFTVSKDSFDLSFFLSSKLPVSSLILKEIGQSSEHVSRPSSSSPSSLSFYAVYSIMFRERRYLSVAGTLIGTSEQVLVKTLTLLFVCASSNDFIQ